MSRQKWRLFVLRGDMPNPKDYTDEKEWMGACVPKMVGEGKDQDQAVAACAQMWRDRDKLTAATMYLIDNYTATRPGDPYRLLPFGKIVKGGKTRTITPEYAATFKLPHFKPPMKLGSHDETTPSGGSIVKLEVREDGLYAFPELTDTGAQAIDAGSYRYHSPEVIWDGDGGYEDPQTGEIITGPLIVGDALLHTPHLGEATALYSVEPIISGGKQMTDNTVQVPQGLWDKFTAWFSKRVDEAETPAPAPALPEEYRAKLAEAEQFRAELETMKAEAAKKARVENYASELGKTIVADGAEVLASMTDEQATWVLQQFSALSVQIKANDKLTQPVGVTGGDEQKTPAQALDAAIRAKMAEAKTDYVQAFEAVRLEKPELFKA